MSTSQEKIEAVKAAIRIAKSEVNTLEALQKVQPLNEVEKMRLSIAKDVVERGETMLNGVY